MTNPELSEQLTYAGTIIIHLTSSQGGLASRLGVRVRVSRFKVRVSFREIELRDGQTVFEPVYSILILPPPHHSTSGAHQSKESTPRRHLSDTPLLPSTSEWCRAVESQSQVAGDRGGLPIRRSSESLLRIFPPKHEHTLEAAPHRLSVRVRVRVSSTCFEVSSFELLRVCYRAGIEPASLF